MIVTLLKLVYYHELSEVSDVVQGHLVHYQKENLSCWNNRTTGSNSPEKNERTQRVVCEETTSANDKNKFKVTKITPVSTGAIY